MQWHGPFRSADEIQPEPKQVRGDDKRMALRDTYKLDGRSVRLNLVLRQGPNPTQGTAFGFLLDLPPEVWEQSKGQDIHLVASVIIMQAGSATCPETEHQSPEDVLEKGIPAFKSHAQPV